MEKETIKLVIFDLDGTLLDTIDDLASSVNYALKKHEYPQHELEAYRYFVGNGARELIKRALPEGHKEDPTVERLRLDFVDYYLRHDTVYTRPYPGIAELVVKLRSLGVELAVASNKFQSATDKLTRHYFGEDTFRVILGQREGIPPKPDPTIVYDILAETGYAPEQSLYIGDSCVDMQTAANCGIESVGVTWGFRPREELEEYGARHLVDTAEEILNLVCQRL